MTLHIDPVLEGAAWPKRGAAQLEPCLDWALALQPPLGARGFGFRGWVVVLFVQFLPLYIMKTVIATFFLSI